MTKAELIESVYERLGASRREATEMVDDVFETIKTTLESGENLKVSGFGSFVVRQKGARIGRNPQTGESITIAPRKVVTFRPSPVLKGALNDGA